MRHPIRHAHRLAVDGMRQVGFGRGGALSFRDLDADGIVAVLDWELAQLGDPAQDLAYLCTPSWRFGRYDRPVGGAGNMDELLGAYEAESGRRIEAPRLRGWRVLLDLQHADRSPSLQFSRRLGPASEVQGDLDDGPACAMHFVQESRIRQAASSPGAAQYRIDETVRYAKGRKPFEHIYRHHRRYRITEGADEIQMRNIAGRLFGFLARRVPEETCT